MRTRAQNINRGIAIAAAALYGLALLGTLASWGSGSHSETAGQQIFSLLFGPLIVVVCGLAYFAPSVVAYSRDHNNVIPIVLLNLVFGWTVLGWVGTLAWAFSSDIKESRVYVKKVIVREYEDRDSDH